MSTLVTPSAKSHERVTGQWDRNIEVSSKKEWFVYYAKHLFGTPIPWLFAAVICLIFVSRAGLEIASWGCALLTTGYILVDRFSNSREFEFFRLGSDFFLLGYVLVGIVTAGMASSLESGLASLSTVRWVVLLYLFAYCWELFPGINRLFYLLMSIVTLTCVYGFWQHFSGVDLIRGEALSYAPVAGHAYFNIVGFFNTPEILGAALATVLPLPTAALVLLDRKDAPLEKWLILAVILTLVLAIFWTYQPGLWLAAGMGLVTTLIMQGRNRIAFILSLAAFLLVIAFISYSSIDQMLTGVQTAADSRAEQQRLQINNHVSLWQNNTWFGVGKQAMDTGNYDPGTGNVYFLILAQSGVFGLTFYLLFILGFMLSTYRIFYEIPRTHYWHRVLTAGGLGGQLAFHMAGLYSSTLAETHTTTLFIVIVAAIGYMSEHYSRGLVPDDQSL